MLDSNFTILEKIDPHSKDVVTNMHQILKNSQNNFSSLEYQSKKKEEKKMQLLGAYLLLRFPLQVSRDRNIGEN